MCHTDVPDNAATTVHPACEVKVPLTDGSIMPALLTRPSQQGGPTLLLIADMYGRSPFYETLAARLSETGCTVLLPEYFFRQGGLEEQTPQAALARRSQLQGSQVLADLDAALDWLKSHEAGAQRRLGVLGFCMGATFALNLSAWRSDVATVAYYGFPVIKPGSENLGPAPIKEVAALNGPVLGFWGDQDKAVGLDAVTAYIDRLNTSDAAAEMHVLPGFGHGFLQQLFDTPVAEAVADSWQRTVRFFAEHGA